MTPREILEEHLPDWNVYLTESGVKKMIAAMEDYAEQQKNISSNLSVSRSADIIKFGAYLTGHDDETIKQMLNDYQRRLR